VAPVRHDQIGLRLVDLMCELERRLTGDAPGPGLEGAAAAAIPSAASYVLVVMDGLGHHQLDHPGAASLRASTRAVLAAPFPSTTTVSLATLATGLSPADHGMIGHFMWMPDLAMVVNVLKWIRPTGQAVPYATERMLPAPNLWERLRRSGVEPITVQPHAFERSPLTRALYRGCRFEGVATVDEAVEATADLSATPGRLVFMYLNHVDLAAHVYGQRSAAYGEAVGTVDSAWSRLVARLPPATVAVGTADHGHIDYADADKVLIRDRAYDDLTIFGDPRSLFVKGDQALIERLASEVGVTPWWVAASDPWVGGRPDIEGRKPDAILLAPERRLLLPRAFDRRLIGYHGGMEPGEVEIPLLVAG
jgi:hypothetical protein